MTSITQEEEKSTGTNPYAELRLQVSLCAALISNVHQHRQKANAHEAAIERP